MYGLVRDRNVSLDDIDSPGTEPPVEAFKSGFIGATDDDLWQALSQYRNEESKSDRGGFLNGNAVLALDETSATANTVKMLYKPNDVDIQVWRVDFKCMPAVSADLSHGDEGDEVDEIYFGPDMKDENGVLDMRKIKDAIGGVWKYS